MYFGEKVYELKDVNCVWFGDPYNVDYDYLTGKCDVAKGDYDCYIKYNEELDRVTSMAIVKSDYKGSKWKSREKNLWLYYDDIGWREILLGVDLAEVCFAVCRDELNTVLDEDIFSAPSGYGDGLYPVYYWCDKHHDIVAIQVKFIEDNGDLVHGTDTIPFEEVEKLFGGSIDPDSCLHRKVG